MSTRRHPLRRKVVLVGDFQVGKSSLVESIIRDEGVYLDPYRINPQYAYVAVVPLDELYRWKIKRGIDSEGVEPVATLALAQGSDSRVEQEEHAGKKGGREPNDNDTPEYGASSSSTRAQVKINGTLELAVWDTVVSEQFRFKQYTYAGGDLFALCASIDDPLSLENTLNKWVPEVLHYVPTARFLLVGLKSDLYQAQETETVPWTREQGERMARQIGVDPEVGYIECSSRTFEGVKDVVFAIAHLGLKSKRTKEKRNGGCFVV
ncbi:hypothetical protein FRC17_000733 [Serendipita sp. 399]|nr:hypothetical protein FRC17_000733 [Serendipita sp. 399]